MEMNKKFAGLLGLIFIAASMLMSGCGDDKNNNGQVQGQCQAGYTWNGTTCQWTGQPTGQGGYGNCSTGYYWNPQTQTCVYTGTGGGGYGGQCPPTTYWNGYGCYCPAGTVWNQYYYRCVYGYGGGYGGGGFYFNVGM